MTTAKEYPPYILPTPFPPAEAATIQKLAQALRLPQLIAELLYRRGWTSPEKAGPFLSPQNQ
ncbi:MAG: hypothetical protein D3905_05840, partial [Candidatus Electrothrix sp. AS4_5]|nr:hypothetical protein [Candidatus Electrothrix gigas]